jgi:hypothetical protein
MSKARPYDVVTWEGDSIIPSFRVGCWSRDGANLTAKGYLDTRQYSRVCIVDNRSGKTVADSGRKPQR